ncbi:MAG: PEP-CTERM sorting domain-containing protein [Betaproteobacteria bacterium]|nr:PEP-CTERM sorting domain-containing protein [Betaproteobacteria bacterium]
MHVAPRWIPWLLAACLASAAHALPAVQARFTLDLVAYPPNPCVETSFLHGEARLRVGDPAAGGSVTSAALTAPLAYRQAGSISLLLPAVQDGPVEIGFEGACKGANGAYLGAVFALGDEVSARPSEMPWHEVGRFDSGQWVSTAAGPWALMAFTPSGARIGTLAAELQVVPEPASAALVAVALLAAVWAARRRRLS